MAIGRRQPVGVVWRRFGQIAAVLIALACSPATFAADADACSSPSDECVAVGRWNFSVALGAGIRTNPLVHSRDIPLIIVPQFSYYGKRFFIDNLDPGVTLFDGDTNTLSLVASPGYDRVFFYRSDLQNLFIGGSASLTSAHTPSSLTLQDRQLVLTQRARKVTYLAGPEWTFKYGVLTGQLDYLHEITGRNHGDEVRAALGFPLGHLGGSWSARVGLTWKSAAIVNYYYGSPGVYDAGPAFNPFAKIGYSRPLSKKWTLDAFVHCERLGNAIADSPIVAKQYVTTAFVGATYVFHQ
jgi:outer membrane protein